jgi:hypothetical protein
MDMFVAIDRPVNQVRDQISSHQISLLQAMFSDTEAADTAACDSPIR